jgi:pyridoxal phosphate enzyme (YggS family)
VDHTADAGVHTALEHVRARIATAAQRSGRDPASVRLVAVTKGVEPARINAAAVAGVSDIGENRVQEAGGKQDQVAAGLAWHLIGHLQTNKAQRAAQLFDAVHSVDSERVARALAVHRPGDTEPLALLLEVELTGLPGRYGVSEAGAEALMRQVIGLPAVHLVGLMTIAPPVDDPDDARVTFTALRGLRDRLQEACGWPLPELSMGMSGDYEVAIEEGATMVRVGRALFGVRE